MKLSNFVHATHTCFGRVCMLVRLMQPLLAQLQRYNSAVLELGHDAGTLQVLVRCMQDRLSS